MTTLTPRRAAIYAYADKLRKQAEAANTRKERERLLQAADAVMCSEFDDVLKRRGNR